MVYSKISNLQSHFSNRYTYHSNRKQNQQTYEELRWCPLQVCHEVYHDVEDRDLNKD